MANLVTTNHIYLCVCAYVCMWRNACSVCNSLLILTSINKRWLHHTMFTTLKWIDITYKNNTQDKSNVLWLLVVVVLSFLRIWGHFLCILSGFKVSVTWSAVYRLLDSLWDVFDELVGLSKQTGRKCYFVLFYWSEDLFVYDALLYKLK